jgi:hypothetical protein
MENDLNLIDDYFNNLLQDNEKQAFEKQILTNKTLANDVAFYLQAKQLSSIEKQQNFADLHHSLSKPAAKIISFKNLRIFSAAASLILVFSMLFLFNNDQSPENYASKYVDNQLITIGTEMSDSKTNLTKAIELYNNKKYKEALDLFKTLQADSQTLEYQGLCHLQIKDYDMALKFFKDLKTDNTLLQNKGAFLEAITLLKMKKESEAKQLLKTISETENNYFGKKEAKEMLLLFE